MGGDLETEASATAKIDEEAAVFGSNHDANCGLSRVLKDAGGAACAYGGMTALHETDDVSDILNIGQGEQSRVYLPSCFPPVSPVL